MASELDAAFWDIVANQSTPPDVWPHEDPDLRAFFDIRYCGETSAVGPERAKLLEEISQEELFDQVQLRYELTEEGIILAVCLAIKDAQLRVYGDVEWVNRKFES